MRLRLHIVVLVLPLWLLFSCVVSKKKYEVLEQELTTLKHDLKDEDCDGVPNYLDLEQNTDTLAKVDSHGRAIRIEKVVDIDKDGILDVYDFCPTIKGIAAANGCPDRDGDGVYDFIDKCPKAAGIKEEGGCPKVTNANNNPRCGDQGIYFEKLSDKFLKGKEDRVDLNLNAVVKVLIENPDYNIIVNGHSNSDSNDSLKLQKLSLKRAKKIRSILVEKGINYNRITCFGYGDTQPKLSPTSEKSFQNNRVEFIIKFDEE